MKEQATLITLQNGSLARLRLANNAGPINNSFGPPLETWHIDSKNIVIIYWDNEFWKIHPACDMTENNEILLNDLLDKRNSLPNMLMELYTRPERHPWTIPLDSDMSASRWAIGAMTVLPDDKYPAEEWFVHQTSQTDLADLIRSAQSRRFTMYYEEEAWSVWPPQVAEATGLAGLGKKLIEKRNALSPSNMETMLNLTFDQIQKTP
jgi:hypothetical protein